MTVGYTGTPTPPPPYYPDLFGRGSGIFSDDKSLENGCFSRCMSVHELFVPFQDVFFGLLCCQDEHFLAVVISTILGQDFARHHHNDLVVGPAKIAYFVTHVVRFVGSSLDFQGELLLTFFEDHVYFVFPPISNFDLRAWVQFGEQVLGAEVLRALILPLFAE